MASTNGLSSSNLIFRIRSSTPFSSYRAAGHGTTRHRFLSLQSKSTAAQLSPTPDYQQRLNGETRVEKAWAHWRKLGEPKLIVAPMYEGSELPFRMLCRKYGAQAAYSPMLHARIFSENSKYRSKEFSTCKEDRPLFIQFCANDPDFLLAAAQKVESYCDYVDINLGCPQRVASRGNYGAFLMDDLPLIKSMVENLATNLTVPVSCKIRVFPVLQATVNYAKMLEESGCSLLAVHGRTRDERNTEKANWKAIRAIKEAVRIPVLANGNIRHMDDVESCLKETGADGVLSAEGLLDNPALFAGYRTGVWALGSEDEYVDGKLDQGHLVVEYMKLCEQYPVSLKIMLTHVYRLLRDWFNMHPDVREEFNAHAFNADRHVSYDYICDMVSRLREKGVRLPLYVKDTYTG